MKTAKKWKLNQKDQVDRMIDEGLGAGRIIEKQDKKKLKSVEAKKKDEDKEINSMAPSLDEMKKLGKEMEDMESKDK